MFVLPLLAAALPEPCQNGYCCDGSIVMKKHNGDFSPGNFWCCQGDPNSAVYGDTGPTSCTAGTQIPLTKADRESQPSSSAGAQGSSTSNNGAAVITNAPLIGAAIAAGHFLLAV